MYRPPAFKEDRVEVLHAAIRAHPLGTLVTHGPSGLMANLVPFTLEVGRGGTNLLRAHLSKANLQLAEIEPGAEALVIFQGPEAYITPSWYPAKRQHGKVVPTWNYVVVQAWGSVRVIDDPAWLSAQIDELTGQQEEGMAEPWAVTDAPTDFIASQLKGITGVEILVQRLEGKWKVSQNQTPATRESVAAGLRERNPASAMAQLVENSGSS
ncbi:FMN-binding negative transcriptional regulator [Sphingomonas swuensis]|uniref:FMN-binding negative transcriptional regulator n=1 Tax=Sphingomonas swuensis TaxID=977800 RepID=A0ABP7S726_9SPHN